MKWDSYMEQAALRYRAQGLTYPAIGELLGTTANSVKHKVRRLQQNSNEERYHHPTEKQEHALPIINQLAHKRPAILETHCGFGGMTEFYSRYGDVLSYDIKQDRVDYVNSRGFPDVRAYKGDSEQKIYDLICDKKKKFDLVDVDPYGMPSRLFPHVFRLIKNGYLLLTFPMMGVAQMNKITIRHYQAFWNIELDDKAQYVEKIHRKLEDYAFMHKREIEHIDTVKIGRVYRMAFKVQKKSLLDIVGLEVNR